MNNIKSFDELRSHLPSEIGEPLRNTYEQLLDKNKTNVKDLIEDIWWKWDNDKLNLIENMSQYNNADKATPVELIEKMFNKLTHDEDSVYYDPCCGTGAIGLYLRSKGIDDDKIYMSDINPSHVEMCKKLGFKHVYQCDVLAEKVNIEYKHMKIIMNPPYSGNLHLKILSHLISLYPDADIVNISPVRWLQDPLAEYKKNSDWKKFEDIRNHIESLDIIDKGEAGEFFDIGINSDIGVYHITKDCAAPTKVNKWLYNGKDFSFLEKLAIKAQSDNWKSHITTSMDGYIVPCVLFGGGSGGRTFDGTYCDKPLLSDEEKQAWTNGRRKQKDWTDERKFIGMSFTTEKEALNFAAYANTKLLRLYGKVTIKNMHVDNSWCCVPYLDDYTHHWTDADLYDYFHLSDDEIAEIEKEIK